MPTDSAFRCASARMILKSPEWKNDMKRLIAGLLISAAACFVCNAGIGGFAAAAGAPTIIPWEIGVPLLIVLFQVVIIVTARMLPPETKKQRIVYWAVSEILFAATAGIWGFVILSTVLA